MLADSYDVVIVGAGVAGCAAALSLPSGTHALLVDRAAPDSPRCCGGLLAPDAQQALAGLGLQLPDEVRVRPEPRFVHAHDLDSGRDQSYRRDYLNLDRGRFDDWLLTLAAARVEVCRRTRFVGLASDRVLLRHGDQTVSVRAGLLIGADGANSTVRRHCFPEHPGPPTMLALQATLAYREPAGPGDRPGSFTHEVLFSSELTDYYAWAIPKADSLIVGSAFGEPEDAKERFERILAWYREQLGLGDEVLDRTSRRLSRPRALKELYSGKRTVLLVGEAAGLVSPSSGEGISFALLSGSAAGRAVSVETPDRYYERYFSHLSRRLIAKTVKARVIYSPRLRSLALRLPWYP